MKKICVISHSFNFHCKYLTSHHVKYCILKAFSVLLHINVVSETYVQVRVFIFNRFFLQQWIQTPACREFLRRKGVLKPSQSVTGGEVIQEVPQIGWRRCMRLLCARWVQDIVWIWSQTRIFILEARLWICDHGVQISVLLNNPRLSLHN